MKNNIYKDFVKLLEHLNYNIDSIEENFIDTYSVKYKKNLFYDVYIAIYLNKDPVTCDEYEEEILVGISIYSNKFQSIALEFQKKISNKKKISSYTYEDSIMVYNMVSLKRITNSEIEIATIGQVMSIGQFLSIIELISTKKDPKALYEFLFYSCFGQVIPVADFYMVYLFLSYLSNISIQECIKTYNSSYIFAFKRKYEIDALDEEIVKEFYKLFQKL